MASRWKLGKGFVKFENTQYGEESSESEKETEPVKTFIRKLSTNREIKSSAAVKEGFLHKQTSFQTWRRRYFKLKGRKLYYAKNPKAVIFDEIEVTNASFNTFGTKNASNSFQIITPFRRLVLAADTKYDMEEWMGALKAANSKEYCEGAESDDFLSGHHHWYATSHARPTYCNVCRDPLSGVTSHGLSCEICKFKVHKRCAIKAINNCKWTTLSSVGQEIIEDQYGNITMPHQWMEGNLPVSSKCGVCDKTCGSVLRLQDWRCLWCRAAVHTACRPHMLVKCPLGLAKVSVVPPTALHSIGNDEAWEAVRPQGCSPLLVFVNSKSGENQGIKFLRRFKQLLNPAQVFDLVHGGPGLGLRLFRHFDPFRILVCSGDGSVGWVLSEIDRLNMHKQCQIGVLPLGTGNDLARVLGWGSSCDDDTHLPQLLDKYEKACTKMLDRWSVMTLERGVVLPRTVSKLSLDEPCVTTTIAEYEDSVMSHLAKIIQSDQHSVVINSARILCETVKEFTWRMAQTSLAQGDEHFSHKCQVLNSKLDLLVQILEQEGGVLCTKNKTEEIDNACCATNNNDDGDGIDRVGDDDDAEDDDDDNDSRSEKSTKEKQEKEFLNLREKATKSFIQKDALMSRANSLKKAVRQLVEYTEQAVDQQNTQGVNTMLSNDNLYKMQSTSKHSIDMSSFTKPMDTLKVMPTIESVSSSDVSPCPSPKMFLSPSSCDVRNFCSQKSFPLPSPIPSRRSSRSSAVDIRLSAISPLPDVRRESTCDETIALPVPDQFADARRKSFPESGVEPQGAYATQINPLITVEEPSSSVDLKLYTGEPDPDKNLTEFERDVIYGFEKNGGPSLWETVVSSLNEDARSIVTDSRMPSRRSSHIDLNDSYNHLNCDISSSQNAGVNDSVDIFQDYKNASSIEGNSAIVSDDTYHEHRASLPDTTCDYLLKAFNSRIEEMDLSHIDSSESPSEEASPPNPSSSPPPPTDIPPKIPPSPRYIHKSYTENFLGVPNLSNVTRSLTNVLNEGTEHLLGNNNDLLKVSLSETENVSLCRVAGIENNRAINRRHSDIKTKKDMTNEFLNNYEYIANNEDNFEGASFQPESHPYLSRKDSRRLYTDNDIDITEDIELEPELRCSLAQFVEGNDIARMSFRKKPRRSTRKNQKDSDMVKIRFKGSNGDLTKEWNEKFNADFNSEDHRTSIVYSEGDDDENDLTNHSFKKEKPPASTAMPEFQVVIDPPSPVHESKSKEVTEATDLRRLSTESVGKLSAFSNYTSGLLQASPQATRRVSNCSLLKADIIQAFADQRNRSKSIEKSDEVAKKLPIINPLVRLPMWPNVSGGAGLISKVLLANADALCATAAPLMDFDETLLEGFYEKCVMNNYFGIGIDAKIALDFHHRREEHPEKCRSRAKNYMWYGVLGSKEWLQKTYKNLEQRVQLECDGQRIPLPSLQGIVVLNIPSFMGGTNFWGGTKEDDCFLAPSFDDRVLEVVAVFGSVQMAASRLINLQHHRIAQCQSVQINVLGDEGVPIQVDGEAWIQPPGVIRIIHKNRMQMLCRNRELETSLKSWEEKQKLSHPVAQQITQESQTTSSFSQISTGVPESGLPELLSEEESRLLLGFIEVTTTLVRCVQLVTISHPSLGKDLYELATKTAAALENVHPGGKIVEGPKLRPVLTALVNSAKDLYEEACSVMRNKEHSLKLREDMEGKLSAALADMEIELRKCSVDENGLVGLHHIFEQSGHKGRGRGLFWLKRRRHGNQRQREAASWGVTEVSQWLESLQLSEYIESFAKNDIRGRELLALARRDLKDLGVTKVGHVKRILQAIRDLNL